jgi:hypothetical protein
MRLGERVRWWSQRDEFREAFQGLQSLEKVLRKQHNWLEGKTSQINVNSFALRTVLYIATKDNETAEEDVKREEARWVFGFRP